VYSRVHGCEENPRTHQTVTGPERWVVDKGTVGWDSDGGDPW
jgi:hypothetical protein